MSDSQDDQASDGAGWLASLGDFFNDGLIQRLLLGKPAARAISRLIGAGIAVPVAGLENLTERISADTAGRKKVQGALATAAAKAGVADEGLVDRAVTRWAGDTVRKQQAREDVAVRTVKLLADDPPPDDVATGPSDDFMSYFEDVAEKASSEALRDLLARILAGEIRKPGTLSRLTLQAVSVMDQKIARALWDIRPWVIRHSWVPIVGTYAVGGLRSNDIFLMDSVSILRLGSGLQNLTVNPDQEVLLAFENSERGIVITRPSPSYTFYLNAVMVSPIGRELLSILPPAVGSAEREVAVGCKVIPGVVKVEVCDVVARGDGAEVVNREQI